MIRRLAPLACALTALVIVFGAYVRLSDAGLGCPDWPGCYGAISPHHAAEAISSAESAQPLGPVSMSKAWKEMIHRYLASFLGLLILGLTVLAWLRRKAGGDSRIGLPLTILGVVLVQALLGKWTVTLLLKPAIVSLHLLGGMTVMSLLLWLGLRENAVSTRAAAPATLQAARLALLLLVVQIALGGWVSTNYAALACTDFPTCQSAWLPPMHFGDAFHVLRELGMTADGERLSLAALTAIHLTHRIGAVVVGSYLLWFASRALLVDKPLGIVLMLATLQQIALGSANVLLKLPLTLAVAHNAGAMLLLALVVILNYRLRVPSAQRPAERRLHEHLAA